MWCDTLTHVTFLFDTPLEFIQNENYFLEKKTENEDSYLLQMSYVCLAWFI